MTPNVLFSIVNDVSLIAWILLAVLPKQRWVAGVLAAFVVPAFFAVAYVVIVVAQFGSSSGGFTSLPAVATLFSNPWLLLAGWIHYLAFDLFIGAWQVRDSTKHRVPHIFVIPCLLLTFLFGPAGLLLYFVIRTLRGMSPKTAQP